MPAKTKRPTAAQLDVLRKMKDGWRLVECSKCFGMTRGYKAYPKKGRCATVTVPTFDVLSESGWVEKDPRYCDDYRLTALGLAALEDNP